MVRKGARSQKKAIAKGAMKAGRTGYEGMVKAGGAVSKGGERIGRQVKAGIANEKKLLAKERRKRDRKARKVVHVRL